MATFTYTPSYSSSVDIENRVLTVAFGDNYEQSTEDGINTLLRTYTLVFSNRTCTEADEILLFFSANSTATTPFSWVAPDGFAGNFKCNQRKKTFDNAACTVSCVFREVSFISPVATGYCTPCALYGYSSVYVNSLGVGYLVDLTFVNSSATSFTLDTTFLSSSGSSYTLG